MYDDLPFYLAIGSMLYRKLLNMRRGAYLFSGALGGAYLEGGAYLGERPLFLIHVFSTVNIQTKSANLFPLPTFEGLISSLFLEYFGSQC